MEPFPASELKRAVEEAVENMPKEDRERFFRLCDSKCEEGEEGLENHDISPIILNRITKHRFRRTQDCPGHLAHQQLLPWPLRTPDGQRNLRHPIQVQPFLRGKRRVPLEPRAQATGVYPHKIRRKIFKFNKKKYFSGGPCHQAYQIRGRNHSVLRHG